jgi:hypothetical protein
MSLNYTKYLQSIFLILLVSLLVYFDFMARPQSDDLGFINILNHFGYYGTYSSMRETFQASPYLMLITFPLNIVSVNFHYGTVLLFQQLFLAGSFALGLTTVAIRMKSFDVPHILGFLLVLPFYFLTWNTDTYQNAVFWVTGSSAYMLPIAFFMIAILLRTNIKTRIWTIPFWFLLAGTQINYILVFGLIYLLLIRERIIPIDRLLWIELVIILMFLAYTWGYPGVLVRINAAQGEVTSAVNFFSGFLIRLPDFLVNPFIHEPFLYLLMLVLIAFLLHTNDSFRKLLYSFHAVIARLVVYIFAVWLVHSFVLYAAFKPGIGYGRVHFLMEFIVYLLTILIFSVFYRKLDSIPSFASFLKISFYTLAIGVVVLSGIRLRDIAYRARNFAKAYDDRIRVLLAEKEFGRTDCLLVKRFPNSGILGYVDLSEQIKCNHPSSDGGYIYPKIVNYDNWVFEEYYHLPYSLRTVPRF